MSARARVAVNGYGVIGKRVADAVRLQPDMELAGVADVATDYRVKVAGVLGIPVYATAPQFAEKMAAAGIALQGTLDELLAKTDVVVDCTPKNIAAQNKALYDKMGLKSVFQGGEKHSLTGHSFVAQANYETALGRSCTRVVSCNTTAIVRTLGALHKAGLLKKAWGTLARRAVDPGKTDHSGIMNTLVPELAVPSHQAPDARTVIPDLQVTTMAFKAAHDSSHAHCWMVEMTRDATRDEILEIFRNTPRVALVWASDGILALNSTVELMADLGRSRGDMWEVALWGDILGVEGRELYMFYQVHNQSIVVPETVDAIRALTGLERDGASSIETTNRTMGIVKDFLKPPFGD